MDEWNDLIANLSFGLDTMPLPHDLFSSSVDNQSLNFNFFSSPIASNIDTNFSSNVEANSSLNMNTIPLPTHESSFTVDDPSLNFELFSSPVSSNIDAISFLNINTFPSTLSLQFSNPIFSVQLAENLLDGLGLNPPSTITSLAAEGPTLPQVNDPESTNNSMLPLSSEIEDDELLEEDESELSEIDNLGDSESAYGVCQIINHQPCTNECCCYEYYIEGDDKVPTGTMEWIHESQIDPGKMYEEYCQHNFTQIVQVSDSMEIDSLESECNTTHIVNEASKDDSNFAPEQNCPVIFCTPFLNNVLQESLHLAVDAFKKGYLSLEMSKEATISVLFQKLDSIHQVVEDSPLEWKTMKSAADTWPLIVALHAQSPIHDAIAQILHQTIMLTHYRLLVVSASF
ncbi:hypothetical protein GYMLUDRAFT_244263 [Collybiopsis luxurians FD-317 M1]|uniref:Uncharacterized protein n=1 Tax=Collybiopsis luxurians FD-317 M1 TaxID=944289 RepID=A0A0D0CDY6_9AGAR|nr:hypothetical protein GYMLUDRAFT_244263 [Collybiopsis luxurians FD-317 M1]